ncbi:MAG: response regulator transcription factor [Hyphomicrobiaceae bacterium]
MTSPSDARTILVVDDEEAVRALLRDCFELEGYTVVEAADTRAAMSVLDEVVVQLVTLDLNLGGDNGLELAQQIRSRCNVPIVMITGKGDTIDRVVGLELGADDYIAKPFHVREVLARVRAVLRRYEAVGPAETSPGKSGTGEAWIFDRWVLDADRRVLTTVGGEPRELTTAEFNMLLMFVRRPSRVLSRDNIMDLLKGHEWSPLDRSIDTLVARLRRKIEATPDTPSLIKTVRGVGYVLATEVRKT